MKISGAKKVHYDSGPNMTPLVDVVMVILIFLMLAGSFGGAEHYLVNSLPISKTGNGDPNAKPPAFPDQELKIQVDSLAGGAAGTSASEGFVAVAGQIRTTDADQLKEKLIQMREADAASGTSVDHVQVWINAGDSVKYRNIILVYQAAADAGYTKIGFRMR